MGRRHIVALHFNSRISQDPTAEIALVEDSVWCPFMHGVGGQNYSLPLLVDCLGSIA